MKIEIVKIATKIKWYMLNYPNTNTCYWALSDDNNVIVDNGNMDIPQDVINNWGIDDMTIENHIISTLESIYITKTNELDT